MSETSDRMKVVVYYAIWATICAALAGGVATGIHAAFFSYNPGPSAIMQTLFSDLVTALAIAAGQGAVILVAGGLLAQLGKPLRLTVLLGLLIGTFDFVMYVLQMAVPATELGWVPDIAILVGVTVVITLIGARSPAAAAP